MPNTNRLTIYHLPCAIPLPVTLLTDAVLLQLLVEIAPRRTDHLGRLRDVPVVVAKLADEKRALGRFLELAESAGTILFIIGWRALRFKADNVAQIVHVDRVSRRHDDQPLD